MKKSEIEELEKFIRHEIRKVVICNFLDFRNDMNKSSFGIFSEKYLPKIVEEVYKMYPTPEE